MELYDWGKGILIGLAVSIPVGPIAILCIKRTLHFGRLSGFLTGLGATCADTLYGAIAAFGVTFISDFFRAERFWLHVAGGFFLILIGVKIYFSKQLDRPQTKVTHQTLFLDWLSSFMLTATNPSTLLSLFAVFAAAGLIDPEHDPTHTVWVIAGLFVGCSCWWLTLSEGIAILRHKIDKNALTWINRCAGVLLVTFGLVTWLTLLHLR